MTLLKMVVMYEMAQGPRCLIMIGEMLSGPSAFEFFDFLIASSVLVWVIVKCDFDDDAFFLIDLYGYYVREWRQISIHAPLLSIPVLLVMLYLPESPRWLVVMGRKTEAETTMENILQFNGNRTTVLLKSLRIPTEKGYTYLHLLRNKRVLKLTSSVAFSWFVLPIIFFSTMLVPSTPGSNRYQSFALANIADIPAFPISIYLSHRIGHRKTNLGSSYLEFSWKNLH